MPVISTRRYSSTGSTYLTPSSTTSSVGSYRSTYSSSSTTASSSSTSRYNLGDSSSSSYPSYRSGLLSSRTASGSGTYSSRYDDDKKSTLSTRIGVSNSRDTDYSRNSADKTLPPKPPSTTTPSSSTSHYLSKRSLSRSRDQTDATSDNGSSSKSDPYNTYRAARTSLTMSDKDFYEKYSPSRYMTKYELSRSRSLSEAAAPSSRESKEKETSPSSSSTTSSKPPTHTPKSEIRSVALRNALPTTTSSSRTWDRDYSTGASLYSGGRNSTLNSDSSSSRKDGEHKNGHTNTYSAAGGYRASNMSPSKSPAKDYDRKASVTIEGQVGLVNIGNTCFMNSVLQCLSHTFELTKYARSNAATTALNNATDKDSKTSIKDQKIWAEFVKLINQMWTTSTRSVNPSELKMALSAKHRMYSGSAQQDAQEFLRYLLDALHGALNSGGQKVTLHIDDAMSDLEKSNEMWSWYAKRENSVVKDFFVGQLKSSLFCTHCEKTSVMYDPFWDLSLPVPSTPNCKLDKCLELFTVKEELDGDAYCDYCKTMRKCIKGFTIQRFPKYLVIHLKRFSEMRWTKLTNIVEFPTGTAELDLTPYGADSMEDKDPAPIYSLYGVSNHMGSTHGGHYVALCKHPITKKWYEYNDNFVSEARESSLVSSSAYLLFYERV